LNKLIVEQINNWIKIINSWTNKIEQRLLIIEQISLLIIEQINS